MEINYWVIALVVLAVVVGLILFFRRNNKDEKDLADELNQAKLNARKIDDDNADKDNLL